MISQGLIDRLRARVGDPARRVDYAPSILRRTIASMPLEEMIAERQRFIDRLSEASQSPPDKERHERAKLLVEMMKTPSASPLPEPVSQRRIEDAEAELGFALPASLAAIYREIADGGFGPGPGLLPLHKIVAGHSKLMSRKSGKPWPANQLTILISRGFFYCIDVLTDEIWSIDSSARRDEETDLSPLFELIQPSLESWLESWLARSAERGTETGFQSSL